MKLNKSETSWILVDVGNSAFATIILVFVFPIYLFNILPKDGVQFAIGGFEWTSTALSIWGYTVSFSIFLTFLMAPLLGAWADECGRRKHFLAAFTLMGAIGSSALAFVDQWQAALVCVVFANIGFSGSTIFYNALLPQATRKENYDHVSLQGFAWGYPGGGVLLVLTLLAIKKFEWFGLASATSAVKLSFFVVGFWWIAFTIPALLFIHEQRKKNNEFPDHTFWHHVGGRFVSIWNTIKSLPKIPMLLLFMIAYAFFNEGIQTTISMSSIYGKEAIGLPQETLIITGIIIQFLGLPFTLLNIKVTKRFGAKKTLIGALFFWLGIILFAVQMETSRDFIILGILASMVLGVSQALPRSIFARLIPEGKHAEFFSFFALSGKMTAVFGPALMGIVSDITGNPRLSMLTLAVFFVLGVSLLSRVRLNHSTT